MQPVMMKIVSRLVAEDEQAVRNRRDHGRPQDCRPHLATTRRNRPRAADHRGGRSHRAAACRRPDPDPTDWRVPGEDHSADAGHESGDHEDEDPDSRDADPGATRRFCVPTDGVGHGGRRSSAWRRKSRRAGRRSWIRPRERHRRGRCCRFRRRGAAAAGITIILAATR